MKNRIIALAVGMVLLMFSSLSAQAPDTLWTKTFGGIEADIGNSVQQTQDSAYIVLGNTWSFGAGFEDIYLIKVSNNGDSIWAKTYGGADFDGGYEVQQTSDGGFIVVGFTASYGSGGSDVYLIKTDSLGDSLWIKVYGGLLGDEGNSVQQTYDGGYIIAGWTNSFGAGGIDIYVIKTDSSGDTTWTKTYGGADFDIAYSIRQTLDGGYIIAGQTNSFGAGYFDVYLIKTDSIGDTTWTKRYGNNYQIGLSAQQTIDSGYIIAGYTESLTDSSEAYLIKTDKHGDTIWTRTYGGTDDDRACSVTQTSDGGYIVVGCTESFGAGKEDIYLIKTDPLGDTLWTKTCGGNDYEAGNSIQQTFDGGYIITGYTGSWGAGILDFWVLRIADDLEINLENSKKHNSFLTKARIFPNPFTLTTRLELLGTSKNNKSNLSIYDASGRLVKAVKLETSTYQLGADLVPGIYFLKLNGKPVWKVVKVR